MCVHMHIHTHKDLPFWKPRLEVMLLRVLNFSTNGTKVRLFSWRTHEKCRMKVFETYREKGQTSVSDLVCILYMQLLFVSSYLSAHRRHWLI